MVDQEYWDNMGVVLKNDSKSLFHKEVGESIAQLILERTDILE